MAHMTVLAAEPVRYTRSQERLGTPREVAAMADALNEMLARLRADNDLDLAAVSADGLVVGADHVDGLDAETIYATAGDAYLVMTAFVAEHGSGESSMLTIV